MLFDFDFNQNGIKFEDIFFIITYLIQIIKLPNE